jgi:hypothetical protein
MKWETLQTKIKTITKNKGRPAATQPIVQPTGQFVSLLIRQKEPAATAAVGQRGVFIERLFVVV